MMAAPRFRLTPAPLAAFAAAALKPMCLILRTFFLAISQLLQYLREQIIDRNEQYQYHGECGRRHQYPEPQVIGRQSKDHTLILAASPTSCAVAARLSRMAWAR